MKAESSRTKLELLPKNRSEMANLLQDIIVHIDKTQFIHLIRILLTSIINTSTSESIINVNIELQKHSLSTFSFPNKNFLKIQISHSVPNSSMVI